MPGRQAPPLLGASVRLDFQVIDLRLLSGLFYWGDHGSGVKEEVQLFL
jgi:hypothetical protein